MKKITLSVAFLLLGGVYIANAQVGIGTPTPATSSQLDIVASDKGVLIPRVNLTSTTVFTQIKGTQEESLLVYNLNTAGDAAAITAGTNVTPGFYYWTLADNTVTPNIPAHWERIVNQTQLDEVINKIGDIDKILALLKKAFPSNNLVNPSTNGDTHGGGMVYTPGNGTTTQPKIEYVYFDGTNYVTKDITADIVNLIKGAESKTTILEFPADSGKFYYISEETMQASNGTTALTTPFGTDGTTLQAGVVFLDIPESVIKNFETILDGTTTIVKPGTTNQFFTVEEYIQYLSSTVDGNVIYKNIAAAGDPANFVFQYWNGSTYTTINLGDIVAANETKTFIREVVLANGNTQYIYFSEKTIQDWLAASTSNTVTNITDNAPGVVVIDATSDVVQNFESILNQTTQYNGDTVTIEEIINEIAGKIDGNVIYKNIGTVAAPNWVFQYWDGTTYQTIDLGDIVAANETKTFIREVVLANGNTQYIYFSEKTIQDWLAASTSNTVTNITDNAPGVVVIDATSDVVQNFESILNQTTQYNGDTVTIEEIINEIAGKIDGNVIYKNIGTVAAPNWVFQYWDGTTYQTINLGDIVAELETKTQIKRSEVAVDGTLPAFADSRIAPVAADVKKGEIFYEYNSEDNTDFINITADIISSITNNEEVQNAITKILNQGGNVYFTKTAIAADTATGQLAIPANSLYTVTAAGIKEIIDISGAVLQVITNNAENIKNILGDTINTTTVVKTGDTFNGGDVYIFASTTDITANSAVTTGITIPAGTVPGAIIGIKIINANGISSNVTDIVITGQKIEFNVGTGNMYNVLGAGTYDVIVEFTE